MAKVEHNLTAESYKQLYNWSISTESDEFWLKMATENLNWIRKFDKVKHERNWFLGGQLNVALNCVDRWAFKTPEKVSLALTLDCYHL